MSTMVTLDQLRQHLRIGPGAGDADLQLKLEIAQGLVLGYIARPDDADWTARLEHWAAGEVTSPAEAVPPQILGAILLQAAELWGFRGDDLDTVKRDAPGDLALSVKALLYRFRDPALR